MCFWGKMYFLGRALSDSEQWHGGLDGERIGKHVKFLKDEVSTFCSSFLQMLKPQSFCNVCTLQKLSGSLKLSCSEVLHTLLSADYMYLWCRQVAPEILEPGSQ